MKIGDKLIILKNRPDFANLYIDDVVIIIIENWGNIIVKDNEGLTWWLNSDGLNINFKLIILPESHMPDWF